MMHTPMVFLRPLWTYTKLSGPGWLQSAITLGGGSLASSLILGIIAGYSMLWLQPLAMILGIVMLGAIGFVTLSTEQRPFDLINQKVNPVLGWGWALAAGVANIVWCLPQFALAYGATSNNLLPKYLKGDGENKSEFIQWATANMGENWFALNLDKLIMVVVVLLAAIVITWQYDRGGRSIKIFEFILKIFVGLIVVAFVGVVCLLTYNGDLPWGSDRQRLYPKFQFIF